MPTIIRTEKELARERYIREEAMELILCADNEGSLYKLRQAIERAALRRIRNGTYDARLGALAWKPYTMAYSKMYRTSFGVRFSPAVRGEANRMLAERTEREAESGELNYLLDGAK